MKNLINANPQTKKEISQYVHSLMNQGKLEELEQFLLQRLNEGERTTIILGSLINLYRVQGQKWSEIEELAKEYLILQPKNLFAQTALEIATKKQGKKRQPKRKMEQQEDKHKTAISQFRRRIYAGSLSRENISEELFTEFTEFEKAVLLAELYSHLNLADKAIQLLKQAAHIEGITQSEKKTVKQAIQLANSKKMRPIRKKMQWGRLAGDEGSEEWEI